MNNLGILDLVIGMFFIYFVLSVICTAILEGIAQFFQLRRKHLKQWIKTTFSKLGDDLLKQDLIKGLTEKERDADYIPSNIFSSALLDILHNKHLKTEADDTIYKVYDNSTLKSALSNMKISLPEGIRNYLLQALEETKNTEESISLVKKRIEEWFDQAMDRVSGAYKKKTRFFTVGIAIIVALTTNADSIALFKYLESNPSTTALLVETSLQAAQDSILIQEAVTKINIIDSLENIKDSPGNDLFISSNLKEVKEKLQRNKEYFNSRYISLTQTGLPLGWKDFRQEINIVKFLGIMMTVIALTFGAPFWFDMINKLVNIRSSGDKPDETLNK